MKRLAAAVLALLVVSATAGAATVTVDPTPDSPLAPTAVDRPGDISESFGEPRWVVTLGSANDTDTLQSWANGSDSRHVVGTVSAANRTVVAAPPSHIGATTLNRFLEQGLAFNDYVESVAPDRVLEYTEPVTLRSNSSYEPPERGWAADLRTWGTASFDSTGMAWSEDASPTAMAEARSAVNASNQTGSGITVAVVDTGLNTANGRVFGNGTAGSSLRVSNNSKSFLTGASVNVSAGNLSAIEDQNGHGTWVSSAIAANTSDATDDGMVPDATILALKALDEEGSGETADIAAAIRYAAEQDADIVSLSLGSPLYSQPIAEAVQDAEQQGTMVVVAAGNSRQTTRWVASPADTPTDAITVGAANVSTNVSATLPAYFSQVGPDPGTTDASRGVTAGEGVDVVAPGMEVTAATPTTSGSVSETTLSGTSMATPIVSGAVAQLLAAEPDRNTSAVRERVLAAAEPLPRAAQAAVGHGYLDANRTVADRDGGSQQRAMTDAARARDTAHEALSDSQGGVLASLLRSLGVAG